MGKDAVNGTAKTSLSTARSTTREVKSSWDQPRKEAPAKPSLFRRPWFVILAAVLLVVAVTIGTWYILRSMERESTDDAFVDAHVAQVSAKVAGRVSEVYVDDNQAVESKTPLVLLDPRDYQAVVQQRQAALQSATAKRDSAQTALAQAKARLVTLNAEIEAARAQVTSAAAEAERNTSDLRRSEQLVRTGAISRQDYEHAKTAAQSQSGVVQAAQKRQQAAEAQLTEGKAGVASAETQIRSAEADIEQAKAALAAAELDLSYTKITAPIAGHVTNRTVERGNYVQAGQALLAIVPREQWVTANFKETQLRYMRPGQATTIKIDAYPGRVFHGHVESIQRGSGAQFSLLPPENATGNYVKVVQRVPVRIFFDETHPGPLGPGMSITPTVFVREIPNRLLIIAGAALVAALLAFFTARWLLRKRSPSAPAA
jgi:membrane fusion protein (multidrug efflux system)